jgi:hypothetical protein
VQIWIKWQSEGRDGIPWHGTTILAEKSFFTAGFLRPFSIFLSWVWMLSKFRGQILNPLNEGYNIGFQTDRGKISIYGNNVILHLIKAEPAVVPENRFPYMVDWLPNMDIYSYIYIFIDRPGMVIFNNDQQPAPSAAAG